MKKYPQSSLKKDQIQEALIKKLKCSKMKLSWFVPVLLLTVLLIFSKHEGK